MRGTHVLMFVGWLLAGLFGFQALRDWSRETPVERGAGLCPTCDKCPVIEHEVVDCTGKSYRDCFEDRAQQAELDALAEEVAEILEVKR
jgi:hypothetical protein